MNFDFLKSLKDPCHKKILIEYLVPIRHNHKSIFNQYLSRRLDKYGPEGYFYYSHIPRTSEFEHNNRFLFLEIDMPGDKVLTCFKHVAMNEANYIRLIHSPTSLTANIDNEKFIFDTLINNGLIKCAYLNAAECKEYGYPHDKECYEDFYSDLNELRQKQKRSKWRSKYSINKFERDPNYQFEVLDATNSEMMNLFSDWKKDVKNLGYVKFYERIFESIEYSPMNECPEDIQAYSIRISGKLSGLIIFFGMLDDTYFSQVVNMAYSDDDYAKKFLGVWLMYFSTKELLVKFPDAKFSYCAGQISSSLKKYKRIQNTSSIKYYRMDF